MKYSVAYAGGGTWYVNKGDQLVGTLRQGITQAWTARTASGERRLIKTYEEYGGSAHPFEIANTMVIW